MRHLARIWFVYERFEHLRTLFERREWEIVQRGELSRWNEQGQRDPVLGLVSIRGRRVWPHGGEVTFTVKEWWGEPPLPGPELQHGLVLAGYHYTAQSIERQVRYCYDARRHPDMPFHVHPQGGDEIHATPAMTVEQALSAFEQRLAEELRRAYWIDSRSDWSPS